MMTQNFLDKNQSGAKHTSNRMANILQVMQSPRNFAAPMEFLASQQSSIFQSPATQRSQKKFSMFESICGEPLHQQSLSRSQILD